MYKVIGDKYEDLLDKHDNVSVVLKFQARRVSTYVHALFSHPEFLLQTSKPLLRKESHIRWYVDLVP